MSIAIATRSVPLGAVTTFRLVNVFEDVKNSIVSWNDARQTRNALAKLSAHQLADIGLSPAVR